MEENFNMIIHKQEMNNFDYIDRGLTILTDCLVPFVFHHLDIHYGIKWWEEGVYRNLSSQNQKDIPETLNSLEEFGKYIDVQKCLILLDYHWRKIYQFILKKESNAWIKELIQVRNRWAHKGIVDFDESFTARALDTIARLIGQIDTNSSQRIHYLLNEFKDRTTNKSFKVCVTPDRIKGIIKSIHKYSTNYDVFLDEDKVIISEKMNLLRAVTAPFTALTKFVITKITDDDSHLIFLRMAFIPISIKDRTIMFKINEGFHIEDKDREYYEGDYHKSFFSKMIALLIENPYFKVTSTHIYMDFNALEELNSNPYGEIKDYKFKDGYLWLNIGR